MSMMVLALTLLAAWLLIVRAPGTPVAAIARRLLVEAPARLLNRITRGHVLLAVLLAAFAALLIWQLEGDGVRLLSLMAPEIVSWLTMVEISVYLDALVAAIAVASTVRLRGIRLWLTTIMARRPARPRARRMPRRPAEHPAANDDEHRAANIIPIYRRAA